MQRVRKLVTFSGRASRSELLSFALAAMALCWIANGLDQWWGLPRAEDQWVHEFWSVKLAYDGASIGAWLSVALFVPSIAVAVRRLHDGNRSAWWMLLWFTGHTVGVVTVNFNAFSIPHEYVLIGHGVKAGLDWALSRLFSPSLVLIVFWSLDGTRGPNRYGSDPRPAMPWSVQAA